MHKILFLLNFLLLNCTHSKQNEMPNDVIELNSHMVICQGESLQWCLQIKNNETKAWNNHYDGIEGLDYQWGYNYFIIVDKVKIDNPPQDGSTIKWILKSVVKKSKVAAGTNFSLKLNEYLPEINEKNDKIKILEKEFLISKSLKFDKTKKYMKMTFQFTENDQFEVIELL